MSSERKPAGIFGPDSDRLISIWLTGFRIGYSATSVLEMTSVSWGSSVGSYPWCIDSKVSKILPPGISIISCFLEDSRYLDLSILQSLHSWPFPIRLSNLSANGIFALEVSQTQRWRKGWFATEVPSWNRSLSKWVSSVWETTDGGRRSCHNSLSNPSWKLAIVLVASFLVWTA
jgi:hypothetical protein